MQSDYEKGLKKFLEFHGFKTYDYNLVETALTHSSYIYDRGLKYTACYERLEFLGDAVLKLITSEYLYRTFPEADEGKLTQIRSVIISEQNLKLLGTTFSYDDYKAFYDEHFAPLEIPKDLILDDTGVEIRTVDDEGPEYYEEDDDEEYRGAGNDNGTSGNDDDDGGIIF